MAIGIFDRVRHRILGKPSKELEEQVAAVAATGVRQRQPKPPTPRTWGQIIIDSLPIAVLVIGGILTACSELIQLWAILGYMMLVSAPILHLLMRIDRNLKELNHRLQERE